MTRSRRTTHLQDVKVRVEAALRAAVRPIPGVGTSEDGADAGFVLDRDRRGLRSGSQRGAPVQWPGAGAALVLVGLGR
jgi:hypothetical protein